MRYGISTIGQNPQVIILNTDIQENWGYEVGELISAVDGSYYIVGEGLEDPCSQDSQMVLYGVSSKDYRSGKSKKIRPLCEVGPKEEAA